MAQAADFLAAIVADPNNDLPRLVYADWLEEQGDRGSVARSEFIRVQCELAQLPEHHPRAAELFDREQALLLEYDERWRAELELGRLGFNRQSAPFRRGFLESFSVSNASAFVAEAQRLGCLTPLRGVTLHGPTSPGLATMRAFLDCPEVQKLSQLRLAGTVLNGQLFEAVCATSFVSLESFSLISNSLQTHHLELLPGSELMEGLIHLRISSNPVRDTGAADLAADRSIADLQRLELSAADIGPAGVAALGESKWLGSSEAKLSELTFSGNRLGDQGAEMLASAPWAERLSTLVLERCQIGDEGAIALANSEGFRNLRQLNLNGNLFGERGLKALRQSAYFPEDMILLADEPVRRL